jgi:hypothetical protein
MVNFFETMIAFETMIHFFETMIHFFETMIHFFETMIHFFETMNREVTRTGAPSRPCTLPGSTTAGTSPTGLCTGLR